VASFWSGGLIYALVGRAGGLGWLADEAFGVGVVGGGEHDAALLVVGGDGAVVDVGGGVQAQAAVPMLVVVPRERLGSAAGRPRSRRSDQGSRGGISAF
jgi:hypothetical protein